MKRTYMHEYQNTRNTRIVHQQELRTQRRLELLHRLRTNTVATHSTLPNYEMLKDGILSFDLQVVYESVYRFRQLLCQTNAPPIEEVVQTQLVPRFVELLSLNNILYSDARDKHLIKTCRIESAWVLTNIASGNTKQTSTIIQNGGIPLLFKMIKEDDEIADQAIWCLGNIAGDKESFRDSILHFPRSLELLVSLYERNDLNLTKNVTWLLSNLSRGKNPTIEPKKAEVILKIFINLLNHPNQDVLFDTLWGISYIINGNMSVVNLEIIKFIYSKLSQIFNESDSVSSFPKTTIAPLVRCIGNACAMADEVLSFLYNNSLLTVLKNTFYKINNSQIRKEICWIISNISLSYEIKEVYDVLFYSLDNLDRLVQVEALYVLMNLEDESIYNKLLRYMVSLANYDENLNDEIVKCVERNCAKSEFNVNLTKESQILNFITSERSEQVKLRFDL